MRISDWSSDVCSSDLGRRRLRKKERPEQGRADVCGRAFVAACSRTAAALRTLAWRERSTADGRPQWTAWRRHAVPQTAGALPWIAFPALRELALRQRCSDEWSVAWGCDWKKKRGRAAQIGRASCRERVCQYV